MRGHGRGQGAMGLGSGGHPVPLCVININARLNEFVAADRIMEGRVNALSVHYRALLYT